MPHLVNSLPHHPDYPIPIAQCLSLVQEAHDYLVQCAATALQAIAAENPDAYWGTRLKRIKIVFPPGSRPELVALAISEHNFTEVYNQCATMERLLDALKWALIAFPNYQVACCHPTTSSAKSKLAASFPDNDLILIGKSGELACFEVSDVITSSKGRDSNQKEVKDLTSLGILDSAGIQNPTDVWASKRLFLVVSAEFADKLRRSKHPAKAPHCRYHPNKITESTSIFEIVPAG